MAAAAVTFAADEPEGDDALMRRAAAGDTAAFGRIVRSYQRRVQSFAARMLGGDTDAASDIGQETFLRLWHARAAYQGRGCLLPYLLQITRNLCLDTKRSRRLSDPLDDTMPAPTAPMDDRMREIALAEAVERALTMLPEEQRAVFVLSHYECLSYREISEAIACPIGTVASRKYLAVDALRRRLKDWIDE